MKELTSYNRVAGYLNKVFDLLNAVYFENTLSRPTITIQSSPKAFGHFSLRNDTWISKNGQSHEINVGAGTLARPIEEVAATLLHEMVHYHNFVNGIQDCSRGGMYHNRRFRDSAMAHGLLVDHHDKYGWTITSPSDSLLHLERGWPGCDGGQNLEHRRSAAHGAESDGRGLALQLYRPGCL